jgi:putative acetyltransferase
MSTGIRRIRHEDWALTRQLRLAALGDAPDAFAATLEDESAMPEAKWRERARSNAEGIATCGFLSLVDGAECGLVVGMWSAEEPPTVELNALWVAPHARRRGAARQLVEAVSDWARERGAARVTLEVVNTSHAAIALYRELGFRPSADPTSARCRAPATRMERPVGAMEIIEDDLSGQEIAALLREHLAGMRASSPPESVHALDLSGLRSREVTFWSVWDGSTLVGCGALKELDPRHGEIKSMRTVGAHLRRGVASRLLAHIIETARARNYARLSLETGSGPPFDPALALYAKFGFRECGPFGSYRPDPFSHFMTLAL